MRRRCSRCITSEPLRGRVPDDLFKERKLPLEKGAGIRLADDGGFAWDIGKSANPPRSPFCKGGGRGAEYCWDGANRSPLWKRGGAGIRAADDGGFAWDIGKSAIPLGPPFAKGEEGERSIPGMERIGAPFGKGGGHPHSG